MFEELMELKELGELKTILLMPYSISNMTIVFNSSAAIGCDYSL